MSDAPVSPRFRLTCQLAGGKRFVMSVFASNSAAACEAAVLFAREEVVGILECFEVQLWQKEIKLIHHPVPVAYAVRS